ncbi:MAG: SDR family oxidoreductase [Alphaproteobacteria bacterium]|jgi:3-oxoacyl-[acyl-carrier protein] reductase|nr:SDR family oxidoreductase [Alphaproteobacteria bacterium]
MRLENKVAIITGSGSGFGEAFAHRFAGEGARIVGVDINPETGQRVADAVAAKGGEIRFVEADVGDSAAVAAAVGEAVSAFGGVDAVLNNAGISYPPTSTVKMTEELYDRVFRINVKSIQLFAQHAVPELKKRGGGSILNTASAAALRPRPGGAAYAASKGAVITFTRALAVELASDNIRVNALAPVAAPTPMVMQQMGLSEAEVIDRLAADIPLGRMCDPADMAASAVFLCSDEASFISGAVLTVDGARSAG